MLTSNKSSSVLVSDEKNLILENGTLLGSIIEMNPENVAKSLSSEGTASVLSLSKSVKTKKAIETMAIIENVNIDSDNNLIKISSQNNLNISTTIDSSSMIINENYECDEDDNLIVILNNNNSNSSCNNSIDRCTLDVNRMIPDSSIRELSSQINLFDTSNCSRDTSKQSKISRKKLKRFLNTDMHGSRLPPQYASVYLDAGNQTNVLPSTSLTTFEGNHLALSVPVIQRSNHNLIHQNFCIRWFSRSSLPFVIGILALGGVACTLGGIVLGSTGLIEHSTQYLSAALLMIGIGVSLLVISGAIWKLSLPDESETCHCLRRVEVCQNCNSPFCNNRIFSTNYCFHEFQHRPPPPSYIATLNECTLGLFLHDSTSENDNDIRISTPPPSYRSYNSLSSSRIISIPTPARQNNNNTSNFNMQQTTDSNSSTTTTPIAIVCNEKDNE